MPRRQASATCLIPEVCKLSSRPELYVTFVLYIRPLQKTPGIRPPKWNYGSEDSFMADVIGKFLKAVTVTYTFVNAVNRAPDMF